MDQYCTAKMMMLVLWHNIVDNWLLSATIDCDIIAGRFQLLFPSSVLFITSILE